MYFVWHMRGTASELGQALGQWLQRRAKKRASEKRREKRLVSPRPPRVFHTSLFSRSTFPTILEPGTGYKTIE